jgi:hypothetical protein
MPQRRQYRRNASRTWPTGTSPKVAWGKNDGAEHRPSELIHPTQPGDLLATGQTQLLDRIHLPDLVGALGGAPYGGRFAARRRGRLLLPPHPALQGACAGKTFEIGLQQLQTNQQIGRSPRRMLLVQQQGLPNRVGWRRGIGGHIGRFKGLIACQLKLPTKVPRRAWRQGKFTRDGGGAGACLSEPLKALAKGQRNRCRHSSIHDSEKVKMSVHGKPITWY